MPINRQSVSIFQGKPSNQTVTVLVQVHSACFTSLQVISFTCSGYSGLQSNEPRGKYRPHLIHAERAPQADPLVVFFSPKSLQQHSKCSPYFKKVSPRSQIRNSGAISQRTDIQYINLFQQKIDPKICYNFPFLTFN